MGTGLLSGVKRPECGVDHPPHLVPMLKKEWSFISAPPHAGFRVKFTFTVPDPEEADHPYRYLCEHLIICAEVAISQELFQV